MPRNKPKKHICHVCHDDTEKGCCSDEIFVTVHDVMRVAKATGTDIDKVARWKKPNKDLYELYIDNPDLKDYMIDGKMLVMKGKDGECNYLDEDGCTIFDARPGVCRMFPFWFEEKGGQLKLKLDLSEDYNEDWCLVCKHNFYESDHSRALEDVGETEKGLLDYASGYKKELDMYVEYKKDLSKGMKPSKIAEKYNIKI